MFSEVIQLLVGGLLLGGIYGLAAFGLSISFGVLNVLNLAHGEFLMLGALTAYAAFEALGLDPILSAMAVTPLFFAFGAGFHLLLLKPVSAKPPREMLVASILVTLGAALAIEDLTAFLWSKPMMGIPYSLPPLEVGGVVVSSVRLIILLFVSFVAVGLQFFLKRTFTGRAIRALTQCHDGAVIVGVPPSSLSAVTFGIAAALAACAGVFYATLFTVSPTIGIPLTVKYLCVVVLGGLGSLVGSVLGGLLLGFAEVLTAYYVGAEWSPCIAFVLLIAVLTLRPSGLMGSRA